MGGGLSSYELMANFPWHRSLFAFGVLFLALTAFSGKGQGGVDDPLRAKTIFDIAQYIEWPNEKAIDTFTVGVLSGEAQPYGAIRAEADERTIRDRPCEAVQLSGPQGSDRVNILYVRSESGYDVDMIYEAIKGKNILLISENYPYYKSMITFLFEDSVTDFFAYKKKLFDQGFSITRQAFMDLVEVKTQADWKEAYQATEGQLRRQKKKVQEQKEKLKELKKNIAEQRTLLREKKAELRASEQAIEEQKKNIAAQKAKLKDLRKAVEAREEELDQKRVALEKKRRQFEEQLRKAREQEAIIEKRKAEIAEKEESIEEKQAELNKTLEDLEQQRLITYLFIALMGMLLVLAFFVYRGYRVKKRANRQLEEKNQEIGAKNEALESKNQYIEEQRDQARAQRDRIQEQNREITESIEYASRIQTAILPSFTSVREGLSDHFVLHRPKDIVSGDFYWSTRVEDKLVITAADCTGHGVPGALMSILGTAYLKEVVTKRSVTDAGDILTELRSYVIHALRSEGEEDQAKDGMDMALSVIDLNTLELSFAGANNPLYIMARKGEHHLENSKDPGIKRLGLEGVPDREGYEVAADKMPVGMSDMDQYPFKSHKFQLKGGERLYMFSDGYPDQFGGEKGKKLKYKPFKRLLHALQDQPLAEQKRELESFMDAWQGDFEQIDDIIIVGLEV